MIQPFKHDLKPTNPDGIIAYTKCLAAIIKYISEETAGDPKRRYIDGARLLDTISVTISELKILGEQAKILLDNKL